MKTSLGPLLYLLVMLIPAGENFTWAMKIVAGTTLWMGAWWVMEVVPSAVASLLPLLTFPTGGVMTFDQVSGEYSNDIIFLFLGSFFMGIAVEKHGLHKRFALWMLSHLGLNPLRLTFGFMFATAFISAWISNTATAAMMLPIGIALAKQFSDKGDFQTGKMIMLGIAYSAGIGGMATPIGTPTNAVFLGAMKEYLDIQVSFMDWVSKAAPLSLVLLLASWAYLAFGSFKLHKIKFEADKESLQNEYNALGKMSYAEMMTLGIFATVAITWITGSFWLYKIFPGMTDGWVSIAGALLFFIVPANKKEPLLDWDSANKIPWGVLLLFGGGLALAQGFKTSELADTLGLSLAFLKNAPLFFIILALVAMVVLLSEVASNVATAAMLMPVLMAISLAIKLDPYGLLFAATLAASCGVALPIATPPNAIVFGSGLLTIKDMLKNGILADVICVIIITLYAYLFIGF